MSVASTDLVVYGAANIQDTDSGTQGGAISTTVRYVFNDSSLVLALADTIEVLSSSAGDTTQTLTVTGRNSAGSIITEAFVLNGTTQVTGSTTFQRILKLTLNGTAVGSVTVRKASDNTAIGVLEPGLLQIRRPFYNVSADASGGSSRAFYEKIFIKNTHASLNLLSAAISEITDVSGVITFDLSATVGDSNSVASRLDTAPTGMLGSFDSSAKNVPGTDLAFGAAIGVWLKLSLAAGASAINEAYTLRIAGSST